MKFTSAKFLVSATGIHNCPTDDMAEVAFIGRSNAGKSSAINTITNQKNLAKTSKTPGRTQLINFFETSDKYRLVDLPGYGFAKVSSSMKKNWQEMITEYLLGRQSLAGLVLIMDSRHPLKDSDIAMFDWALHYNIPTHILLTKVDKLSRNEANKSLTRVRKFITPYTEAASVQLFSSSKKQGVDELKQVISQWSTDHIAANEQDPN